MNNAMHISPEQTSSALGVTERHGYSMCVIPPSRGHGQEVVQLTAAMHSLVLNDRHPIALELVGTAEQRRFVIRATSQEGLDHAITQLRARYPLAYFRSLLADDDPFVLRAGETISAIELKAGAAAYLPLRSWTEDEQSSDHAMDPLLGVLGALDTLPPGVRVISQLALAPAPMNWSRRHQRKAIEHALEPAREKERHVLREQHRPMGERGPSLPILMLGALLLVGVMTYSTWKNMMPISWQQAIAGLLHDIITPHPGASSLPVSLSLPALIVASILVALFIGIDQLRRRYQRPPIYDQALVGQKTSQMAYRVRFRLYVISADDSSISSRKERDIQQSIEPLKEDRSNRAVSQVGRRIHIDIIKITHLCKMCMQRNRRHHVLLARMVAAYRQYHLAAGNYFVPRRLWGLQAKGCVQGHHDLFLRESGWWRGLRSSRHLMSVDTLASLWHLPAPETLSELASMEQTAVRTLPLPVALIHQQQQGIPIGLAEHAGHCHAVTIPQEVLNSHLFIGGKSGEGKSTCLEYLAREAMEQGGLVVIDPHGDLVDHILALVPEHRSQDVVLVDLSNDDHVIGLNPLDAALGRGRDKAVSDLLKTLAHIWAASWGSRMETAFAYALRTLFEVNRIHVAQGEPQRQYTLLDVMLVLTDESFCHALLDQIEDPFILRWWHLYYDPLNAQMQRDRSDPVLSKVAKFESLIARRIVGQAISTINFTECIEQEKIVLVKLAKGVVGEDVARLLGATLLGLLQITLEEQGNRVETQRKRLRIIIDEFQTLQGVDWGALAELRKYGAAFYLATQSLEYLSDMDASLLHVVLANVKQYIVFHMSAQDALTIHSELGVEAEDIVNLDRYMCYVKLLYQQHRQPTFSMRLLPPSAGEIQQADLIRLASQKHYTVPAYVVDAQLREALAAALMLMPAWNEDGERAVSMGKMDTKQSDSLARQDRKYRGRKSEDMREKATSQRGNLSSSSSKGKHIKDEP
ncbi:hypothetical protein KDW_31170 [Dictyobacter vulcani]|uniref:Type IV secretion system coupling protein TraD DNA-binding domain-containing protein n=1 Tax=Dictyobacter vulcani TaxID=2607529 RepID=A0A5J4KM62_9CHLR|nr:type IV secretion system DNA-binding domain-containing protein [Dictyobacter vulcani]GER88955.1 hypothetical protein KDW_31170 [Dictyobacter vulcani]